MLRDLRFAIRGLRQSPLGAAVAVITLGLGIGGATAVFSVVQAVLLRPLPFFEPDRLVRVWELTREGNRFSFSEPNYLDLREQTRSLQQVAAYNDGVTAVLAEGGEPQRIRAVRVSASLCDVLGVRPQLGRMFSDAEDRAGAPDARVLLSDGLWRRRFNADPGIVGHLITLDSRPFVVTGVMPAGFQFPDHSDAWIPLGANPASDRGNKELAVIGRLARGTTPAQLEDDLRDIARRLSRLDPEANAGWSIGAAPFSDWLIAPRFRDAVWVLFGAVGVLLLLACANVANLLAARAAARRAEIRVRAALGASRSRLVRQLFTEAALLAALGTGAGVLFAVWSVDGVRALGLGRVPRLDGLLIDTTVLGFACLAGAVSCLVFGLAPVLHAVRVDIGSAADDNLRHTSGNRKLRHALVVIEVALALLLLVSAGLMAGSFVRLMRVDQGFDTADTIAMPIELSPARHPEDRVAGFYGDLLERIRAVPGVVAAGASSTNPFRQSGFSNSVTPEALAAEAPPSGLVQAGWRSVTPGFFDAMRIPILQGRAFGPADGGAERVVIVSERLARRLWPGEPAVGQRIYWGGTTGQTRTVIGVAGDIRDVRLETEPPPMLFLPHAQVDLPAMTVIVRTPLGAALAPALRDVVRGLDPALPAPPIYEMEVSRAEVAAGPRFNLLLFTAFATLAVVLAVSGVYAMLAFTVLERRRDIAVRLALGADGARVTRLVLQNGLTLALAGIAVGSLAALVLTRVLSTQLYGIEPTDPLTFAAAAAALLGVAALACYVPARHASRLDPMTILRE